MELKEINKRKVILEEQIEIAIKDFYASISDNVMLKIKYYIVTTEVSGKKFPVRGELEIDVII